MFFSSVCHLFSSGSYFFLFENFLLYMSSRRKPGWRFTAGVEFKSTLVIYSQKFGWWEQHWVKANILNNMAWSGEGCVESSGVEPEFSSEAKLWFVGVAFIFKRKIFDFMENRFGLNNTKKNENVFFYSTCPPGGNQVEGLPLVSSLKKVENTNYLRKFHS